MESELTWFPASTTEMLKRRMRQEEEKRSGACRSEIFSVSQSKFERDCSSYELLPDADGGIEQLLWGNLEGRLFDFMDIVFYFKLN